MKGVLKPTPLTCKCPGSWRPRRRRGAQVAKERGAALAAALRAKEALGLLGKFGVRAWG